jgi:hypothetical protein
MAIDVQQLSDADAEALLAFVDQAATNDEGAKRAAVLRAILSTVAMQAAMIERLERRAFLDEGALTSIGETLSSSYNLPVLQQAFGAPTKGVDVDEAMGRITALTTSIRNQTEAKQMFIGIAKLGLSLAKVFV